MKRKIISAIFTIVPVMIFAINIEQPVESNIKKVTVFLQGAQVTREASFGFVQGRSAVVLENLCLNIDPNTIRIKSEGDFYILSVHYRKNFLKGPDRSEEVQKYVSDKAETAILLENEERKLVVLRKQETLIQNNTPLSTSKENYWTLDELKNLVNYFNGQFDKLSSDILECERKIKVLNDKITLLNNQISSVGSPEQKAVSEVVIQIYSTKTGKGNIELQYITPNAQWKPGYDFRVQSLKNPVKLSYKADILQNTGEDWSDVKLVLSTKNPYASEKLQVLKPWYIEPVEPVRKSYSSPSSGYSFSSTGNSGPSRFIKPNGIVSNYQKGKITGVITGEDGTPLPGVNVVVKGTTTGTVTDLDGRFQINIDNPGSVLVCSYIGYQGIETAADSPVINFILSEDSVSLQEVVVVGYGSGGNDIDEKQQTEEPEKFIIKDQEDMDENYEQLEVVVPYTVPADGKEYTAVLTDLDLNADYVYKSVPKLSRDIFLQARISGYGKYMLKPGNASLFYQGTFLGEMDMKFDRFQDTLDISFGNEEKIIVKREKITDKEQEKLIGLNKSIEKNFRITVKNTKNETVNVQIQDQYPVAVKDVIQCEPIVGTDAVYDEKTGLITWKFELKPFEEKEILFGYRIKFPKNKRVIQE